MARPQNSLVAQAVACVPEATPSSIWKVVDAARIVLENDQTLSMTEREQELLELRRIAAQRLALLMRAITTAEYLQQSYLPLLRWLCRGPLNPSVAYPLLDSFERYGQPLPGDETDWRVFVKLKDELGLPSFELSGDAFSPEYFTRHCKWQVVKAHWVDGEGRVGPPRVPTDIAEACRFIERWSRYLTFLQFQLDPQCASLMTVRSLEGEAMIVPRGRVHMRFWVHVGTIISTSTEGVCFDGVDFCYYAIDSDEETIPGTGILKQEVAVLLKPDGHLYFM